MILTGEKIIELGIVTDMIDEARQVQSCGIDLSVNKIESYRSKGSIDFDNSKRSLPRLEEVGKVGDDWHLSNGSYLITVNETTTIPKNYCGIARPRSSLLRMGATICTALWDPGYSGKPQVMLIVSNMQGIIIHPNAKLLQIVFLKLDKESEKLYNGQYQGEGL